MVASSLVRSAVSDGSVTLSWFGSAIGTVKTHQAIIGEGERSSLPASPAVKIASGKAGQWHVTDRSVCFTATSLWRAVSEVGGSSNS